jgi:nicotinate-nucleotide--dimethylbenzimidazole phosphoribosyltransferase
VGPALDATRFRECLEAGREAVAALGGDLLVLGEMGIGNTTAASAVCASLLGGPPELWVGPGTGLDARGVERKLRVVTEARERLEPDAHPFEVLAEVGGAELVALAGAALEARMRSTPVVLDGFVVTAAVLALEVARPGALDHCVAGHRSQEPGHRLLLEKLGLRPLLDLELRLGEGSGGLLAVPLLRAAAASVVRVPTFEEWGLA